VARFAGEGGQTSHEGAADAEDVNVHRPILGGGSGWLGAGTMRA
jgi:hypothetical protein